MEGVNEAIEGRLMHEGLIVRNGEWYAGRQVMVTHNDYGVGVFSRDVGIALPDASAHGRLRVYFQNDSEGDDDDGDDGEPSLELVEYKRQIVL